MVEWRGDRYFGGVVVFDLLDFAEVDAVRVGVVYCDESEVVA